ncbi:serine hydrolase domain-containing protein [Geodermatophilus sp. URMC 64]
MPPPPPRDVPADLPDAVREVAAEHVARHRIPGLSLAVTRTDRMVAAAGLGFRDLATRQPATADTGYLWFSMSKIVTATAAMRLADEGRLDLDAPVTSVLPAYRRAGATDQPRIGQLLNHTAGAGNPFPLRWVLPAGRTVEEQHAAAAALLERHGRPRRTAGGPASYSNVGYLVLAEVISRVAREPFEDYVQEAVLTPAGMAATGYVHRPGGEYATGYVAAPPGFAPVLRRALPAGVAGERYGRQMALRPFRVVGAGYGGLIGPVVDVARLLRLHLGDGAIDGRRVLAPETAQAMRDIRTPGRPFDLGLGWFRRAADRSARPSFVEHWGTGGGFWNAVRLYPDLGLGIALMANTSRRYDHDALMRALVSIVGR